MSDQVPNGLNADQSVIAALASTALWFNMSLVSAALPLSFGIPAIGLALLVGCAPARPVEVAAPAGLAPTATEFHVAMEANLPDQSGGRDVIEAHCPLVRQLKCVPAAGAGRYRCSYVYYVHGRGQRGAAIVERSESGPWRWIKGPSRCSVIVL
ncbi:MAG: hypothetical protein JWN66_187 [Sphingomonas bacterium]|uniref:hypothetical protein n=1 Tax=Sphingomonas bacterium TaxID=1895847 RepID=UPI00260B2CBB|nr:hypothetical protein [Sphingomonas bacterium]MDB5703071.1 hypothetical protein [Sphingomonas bacterium]